MKLTYKTDSELISKYKKKASAPIFVELMGRYRLRLYSYILRMVKNEASAEDVYQEVWLKFARSLDNYKEEGKFSNYIFFIATNACYDFFRKNNKIAAMVKDEKDIEGKNRTMDNLNSNFPNPEQESISREENKDLTELIEKLPEKQKEVILLRGEGFTFKEISEMTDTSINSLLSRMRYAVDKIKKSFRFNGI